MKSHSRLYTLHKGDDLSKEKRVSRILKEIVALYPLHTRWEIPFIERFTQPMLPKNTRLEIMAFHDGNSYVSLLDQDRLPKMKYQKSKVPKTIWNLWRQYKYALETSREEGNTNKKTLAEKKKIEQEISKSVPRYETQLIRLAKHPQEEVRIMGTYFLQWAKDIKPATNCMIAAIHNDNSYEVINMAARGLSLMLSRKKIKSIPLKTAEYLLNLNDLMCKNKALCILAELKQRNVQIPKDILSIIKKYAKSPQPTLHLWAREIIS